MNLLAHMGTQWMWGLLALLWQEGTTPAKAPSGWLSGYQQADITSFLWLSVMMFSVGVAGALTRRNVIIIFMSIELILNAANINFIAFARYWQTQGSISAINGQILTIFVIVVAAAEAAIGLAMVIAYYRNRETIAVDEIHLLKW